MRVVLQRVSSASVSIDGIAVGSIGRGLAILVGIRHGDTEADADSLARKVPGLRVFEDENGKMNISAHETGAEFLVVSQFTLYANTSKGRRPSFVEAADPTVGEHLYERFVSTLRETEPVVETGRFGAHMRVSLVNDGPVTLIIDSDAKA